MLLKHLYILDTILYCKNSWHIYSIYMRLYTDIRIFTDICGQPPNIPPMGWQSDACLRHGKWVLKNRRNFSFFWEKKRCPKKHFSKKRISKIFVNLKKSFVSLSTSFFHSFLSITQTFCCHTPIHRCIQC